MLEFLVKIIYEDKQEEATVAIPSKLSEISLSKFSEFIEYRNTWNPLFRKYEESDGAEKVAIYESITETEWKQYLENCTEAIILFMPTSSVRWVYKIQENAEAQLFSLYYILLSVMSQPTNISHVFTYKDSSYILPEDYTNRNKYSMPGYSLSVIEAIEAFQYEHFYNARIDGDFLLSDRRRQTIMAQLAALCRKVEGDKAEKMPLVEAQRRRFMDERIDFFADITLDIAYAVENVANDIKIKMETHTQIGELFNNDPKNPSEAKMAIKQHVKWQRWGWYTLLQDIASGGMFNVSGLTPMESAMRANFWDAMFWLAHRADMSRI